MRRGRWTLGNENCNATATPAALRHPEVLAAIASGALGRIAVIYFEWAGFDDQEVIVPWTVIARPEDAFAFADKIAIIETPRKNETSISGALDVEPQQVVLGEAEAADGWL